MKKYWFINIVITLLILVVSTFSFYFAKVYSNVFCGIFYVLLLIQVLFYIKKRDAYKICLYIVNTILFISGLFLVFLISIPEGSQNVIFVENGNIIISSLLILKLLIMLVLVVNLINFIESLLRKNKSI